MCLRVMVREGFLVAALCGEFCFICVRFDGPRFEDEICLTNIVKILN